MPISPVTYILPKPKFNSRASFAVSQWHLTYLAPASPKKNFFHGLPWFSSYSRATFLRLLPFSLPLHEFQTIIGQEVSYLALLSLCSFTPPVGPTQFCGFMDHLKSLSPAKISPLISRLIYIYLILYYLSPLLGCLRSISQPKLGLISLYLTPNPVLPKLTHRK